MLLCLIKIEMRAIMSSNLCIIAKSGWRYIAALLFATILFSLVDATLFTLLSFLLLVAALYIFRNPEREMPRFEKNSIVLPVDGIVKEIKELESEEYKYRIDIESSYLDVAILRAPINAKVATLLKRNGSRTSLDSKLFESLNENCEIVFQDERGDSIKLIHRASRSFVPLYTDIIKNQTLYQASRYGFMQSGMTSIYLPSNVRINVNISNEVKAGETLLGYFS